MPSFVAASVIAAFVMGSDAELQGSDPITRGEVIAEILIQGNVMTPDAEIVRLAGIAIGAPFEAGTLEAIRRRLRDAHRFEDVDVLKRFASIADPTKVVVVIVVNEGAVRIKVPEDPAVPISVVKRRAVTNFMWVPILDGEDGYGLTYGVRFAYVGVTGKSGRVSFPLTWGGSKKAGAEFDRTFQRGPLTRVQAGVAVERRRNPAFDQDDDRQRVWGRVERAIGPLRLGATMGRQHVSFGSLDDRIRSAGVDASVDTRLDPVLPRNAVFVSASWTRLHFQQASSIDRARVDARAYLGLVGQSVVVFRAQREDASRFLPPYLKPLLGGWSNLRGFKAGSFIGDTLVAGSVEMRMPVSSPLSFAKFGLSVFADTGTVYSKAQRYGDEPFQTGIGAGVWMALTAFQMGVSVAHGRGASTRVNFGAGLAF